MSDRILCDICARPTPRHWSFVVRIDVFADPSMPAVSSEDMQEMDYDYEMKKLMEQMKHLSAQELQDQVHRRLEYHLCPPCHRQFLSNPLGLPRITKPATN